MCCSSIPLLFLLVTGRKGSFSQGLVQDWAGLERDGLLIGLVCLDYYLGVGASKECTKS